LAQQEQVAVVAAWAGGEAGPATIDSFRWTHGRSCGSPRWRRRCTGLLEADASLGSRRPLARGAGDELEREGSGKAGGARAAGVVIK
jgi:hypothetical protein